MQMVRVPPCHPERYLVGHSMRNLMTNSALNIFIAMGAA